MNLNLKLDSLDNRHIILDVGLTFTKCGFAKDSLPSQVIPTPFSLVQKLRDNVTEVRKFFLLVSIDLFSLKQTLLQRCLKMRVSYTAKLKNF
jgi:hypothetical protein